MPATRPSVHQVVQALGLLLHAGPSKVGQTNAQSANNGTFFQGFRNVRLTQLAGSYFRQGLNRAAIEFLLLQANTVICVPPLPEYEVRQIAASAAANFNAPATPVGLTSSLNDAGNADRFALQHSSDAKYIPQCGDWIAWVDGRWLYDKHQVHVTAKARATAAFIYQEMVRVKVIYGPQMAREIQTHAAKTNNLPKLKAMLDLVSRSAEVVVQASELDKDRLSLGLANGVLNLRTRKLRDYSKSEYILKTSPVAYSAGVKCPVFLRFLQRITAPSEMDYPVHKVRKKVQKEYIRYLQRVIGSTLTGKTDAQVVFFFYGSGANGKSTLLKVMHELLGPDLAKNVQPQTLMDARTSSAINNDIARLDGARLVTSNETEAGQFLSESLIKQLSGGDSISARFLYGEYFDFYPQFKLVICGNHKPIIKGTDNGIWRRIHLLPFTVTIPVEEQDKDLDLKLRAELPGILNWALRGTRDFLHGGLRPPKLITQAVHEYREDMDLVGQWISENCEMDVSALTSVSDLHSSYCTWAERAGYRPMGRASLGRALVERGFKQVRKKAGQNYAGIRIQPSSWMGGRGMP